MSSGYPQRMQPASAVNVCTLASASQLPMLRSVASAVATTANLDLDAIADLRVAVDEACTQLMVHTAENSMMFAVFEPLASGLRITVAAVTEDSTLGADKSFGSFVLELVTDTIDRYIAPASILLPAFALPQDTTVAAFTFTIAEGRKGPGGVA